MKCPERADLDGKQISGYHKWQSRKIRVRVMAIRFSFGVMRTLDLDNGGGVHC